MIEGIPKISVLIICYKQEELIKRAINSLLPQKDYIYEICVSDDCSPDKTWEVLQEYDKQYPGLFKLHQNRPNVGIFENIEYSWTMPSGDIIYQLSGDDECGENWFKTVIDFIRLNKIDYKNELFSIYGDYQCKYPNGDSVVHRNDSLLKNNNILKLAIRGLICNRSCCYSIHILKKFFKCSQGRSHIAEDAQDRQLQIFSEKNYYIRHVGNIYNSYVGVSTQIDENILVERLEIPFYAYSLFHNIGIEYDKFDKIYYFDYCKIRTKTAYKITLMGLLQMLYYYLKSYDCSIRGGRNIRDLVIAVLRRVPHSKPITFN